MVEQSQNKNQTDVTVRDAERSRYQISRLEDRTFLSCGSAPNVELHVQRGLAVAEAGRKKFPKQSIFLDGAYTGAPFLDNETRQYSFDHHAGCVRAFTLSSCEQAAVMLLHGLPLNEGTWRIYVNEPDLDALIAAWLLLNHPEVLADDKTLLRQAMPLIRVEGIIDGHGLDMEIFSGLPQEIYNRKKEELDFLLAHEREIKARGAWNTLDFLEYSKQILDELDHLLYPQEYLARALEIEILQHLPLHGSRVAFLVRSHQGIYSVETHLKERYDKQVGVIVLDLGGGRFTLRQSDPFLPRDLRPIYKALNQRDPQVSRRSGQENLWGGAEDIGGSPRRTGTGLTGMQILQIIVDTHQKRENWFTRLVDRFRR